MEGYALSALLGAVSTGVGAWLVFGRNTVTKGEQEKFCDMRQAPIKGEIVHLREGQTRLEKKVDESLLLLRRLNGGK